MLAMRSFISRGRLVGEGEREDAEGVHFLCGHQVRDAHGEHLRLAEPAPAITMLGPSV
jgi:hypothetical protein